jgi:hypothetical protein
VVDPGPNGLLEHGGGDDLMTEVVIGRLAAARQTLLMLDYGGSFLECYRALARPTGGDGYDGGNPAQVRDRIVEVLTTAAAHIGTVELVPVPGACPVEPVLSPARFGPIDAPASREVTATFTVPPDGGVHRCQVAVVADGLQRSVETFEVTAPEADQPATAAPAGFGFASRSPPRSGER